MISRLSLVFVALATFISFGLVPQGAVEAQVSALPLDFSDVVIFGTNSVRIEHHAQVVSGHVVVNNASPGPTLSPGFELGIDKNVVTSAGYAIVGDSISIAQFAVINGNAFYNNLSNAGTINGSLNTPLLLPVFAPLPTFQTAVPGTLDVTVAQNGTQTIAPGNYRDITLAANATLRFSGPGVYNIRSITAAKNCQLLFQNLTSGKADVRVLNQVTTGADCVVGPDDGDPLKAAKIIFYVAYASGPTLTPAAASFGKNTVLKANVYAPNGTVNLNEFMAATGAFLSRDVQVDKNVQINLESFFSQQAPAITSANSTTFAPGLPGQTFLVTTTGVPTNTITRSGTLPSGVTFTDNGDNTATIAGTPAAGTQSASPYAWVITASNGVPPNAMQNFTFNVVCPTITVSGTIPDLIVNQPMATATFTQAGGSGAITWSATGLPNGVSINPSSGDVTGTPTANGSYSVTITATDAGGCAGSKNLTVMVKEAPAITSANAASFNIGVFNTFSVTTTGFPTPGIAQGGTLPSGVSFIDNGNGTGTLSGTPGAGTAAMYPLTFTASNGVPPNAVQNFSLTVVCPAITVNPVGPALPDGTFGVAYSQTFTASGGSAPHTFAVTAGALPGGLTLAAGGALTGSPTNTGNFSFTVTATDAFGCTGSRAYTIFVRPNAQADAYADGVGNTQFVVGASVPSTPNVFVSGTVLANDAGPAPLSAGPASITSTNGGSVALNSNGTFTYTPPVGFAGPSDTFNYTLTDGNGITASATVTINLSDVVWFVDNTYAGGNGASDGRSHRPFTTLAAAEAPSLANQYVFVHQGVGPTVGGIALDTGQTLWGQGATFTLHGLTITATARPTVTGTITLNTGTTVRALDVSSAASPGVNDPAAAITGVSVSEVSVTTTVGTAVNLTDTAGTLSFTSISANGGTNGIVLQNTTGSFTVTGSSSGNCGGLVVNNNTAPTAPDPADCTGGTIQNTATGIRLDNAQNVSLTRMRVTGTSGNTFGIYGTSVDGLTLSHSLIDGSIGALPGGQDAPLVLGKSDPGGLNGLSGTNSITDSTIRGGIEHNVEIYNQSGSFALTIARTVIRSNHAATGSDGILLETQGTATGTVIVDNSYFDDNRSQAFQANALNSSALDVTVKDSWLTRTTQGNEGLIFQNATDADLTVHITGNRFTGVLGTNVLVGSVALNATANANLIAVVSGNAMTVGASGGPYPSNRTLISFPSSTNGQVSTSNIVFDGNTINTFSDPINGLSEPIFVSTPDATSDPSFTATVTNNVVNIDDPGGTALRGIALQSTQTVSAGCFDVRGNDVNYSPSAPPGVNGIRLRQAGGGTAQLEQGASAGTAAAVLAANNPLSTTEVLGTVTVVGNSTCLPPAP